MPARHVPRPRLTRLLDRVTARAVLITAPAGYGKTTLAAEWLAARPQVAWYRATSASADLAVFSIAVAEAVSPFAAGAHRRVSQRLQVGETPEETVQPLAEILAEDLAEWPEDAWLAIDDYHLVAESPTVERFVSSLLDLAPIRLVVTSRRRPSWASARKILYGELVEVGPEQLAMKSSEAAQALGGRTSQAVRALVEQAQGWPALIGLAALTPSLSGGKGRASGVLFRYFAEEVLRQEPSAVQEFMLRASVPPSITLELARDVLEAAGADELVQHLQDEGLLHENGEEALSFHPLLRGFLQGRLRAADPDAFAAVTDRCVEAALARQRWDEAFELASSAGRRELMVRITSEAADDLFSAYRLETVDRWLAACGAESSREAGLAITQARLLLRSGSGQGAEALAREAIKQLSEESGMLSTAWLILGASLYDQSRYEESLAAYASATHRASTSREKVRALWSAVMSASMLESTALDQLLKELESTAPCDLDAMILVAHAKVVRASRGESLTGVWDVIQPLLVRAEGSQPLVRLRFLNVAAYVALSRSDYETARRLGEEAMRLGRSLKIGHDRAWPLIQLAAAELAVRDFGAAGRTLAEIEDARPEQHPILRGEVEILRAKFVLFQHGPMKLIAEDDPKALGVVPEAVLGEYFALVALAAAACGDSDRVAAEIRRVNQCPQRIESRYYARFAHVIARDAVDRDGRSVRSAAIDLLKETQRAAITDAFVIAYRAHPRLLQLVANDDDTRRRSAALLAAAQDETLARQWGYEDVASTNAFASNLTPRETEVLALLSSGLTNAQIAERLWVSPSTAKVHVHNVLGKLGVKTRTQAVIAARALGSPDLPPYI